MSQELPFPSQSEPEVWLILDGHRCLARLRAAGPSWIHVFIDGSPPASDHVPFTVVLRGGVGGVVDGLSEMMSTAYRDGRTILHLRLVHLTTSGCHEILQRFVRDILQTGSSSNLEQVCTTDDRALRAIHRAHRSVSKVEEVSIIPDALAVSKPVILRVEDEAVPAELVRTSTSGRRIVVRRPGLQPSLWETVRLAVDLGAEGEPRPVQLVGMVIGTIPSGDRGRSDVVIRLTRWSYDSDRAVWTRWIQHQMRLLAARSRVEASNPVRTVTVRPPSGPPT